MPELAHPSVIIGLGGTGKWALTYIKKNLLDTYGGVIPPTVRLLAFDTTSEHTTRDGEKREEDVQVGDTQLDGKSEFIYLGGNIEQICRDIRDKNAYPHIGSWFQARTYLQSTDPRAFDISGGAGQKRPFGRMSVFYDLQQSAGASIPNKITSAINDVIAANQQRSTVEIYIIASLAGGTGAGTFIDVAHLARWYAAKQIRTGFAIRGFLALHNTFNTVININDVQPQAFAALRELDRFMLVFDQHYPIVYNPSNPQLNTIYGGQLGKLFDNCYLLDATREKMPLDNIQPKYGVYPSIADAITMLLDGATGEAYTQHYINVNNRIANVQSQIGKPIYSSLGAYSLILPVEDIITSLSYRFARDLLAKHLLNIEEQPGEDGQMRYILKYEGNAKQEAATFLQSPRSASGIASTGFIVRTPTIVDNRNTHDNAYITEIAELQASELLTWIIPPESDPTVEELARKVREELEIRLANRVQPSNIVGDDPVEGCDRVIRGVRDFKEDFLGRESSGRKIDGAYEKALKRCVEIHRERYRKLLREYLVTLLNGSNPGNLDFQHEKVGRLGRAQALLSHISISYFNEFTNFLDRVQKQRAKSGELSSAQESASLQLSSMQAMKGTVSFLGTFFRGLHPAIKAQRDYIEAEQEAIDIEINDLFFAFIQKTSRALQDETDMFKTAIDGWITTLVQGVAGEVNNPGLYRYLSALADDHSAEREEKQTRFNRVRKYVTDEAYEDKIYELKTTGKFNSALVQMNWSFKDDPPGSQVRLDFGKYLPLNNTLISGGRNSTERNCSLLLGVARSYFESLRDTLNIADRLAEEDPLRLVNRLRESCVAMVRLDPMRTGGEQTHTYFVCVHEGNQRAFFTEFRKELRQIGNAARENQMLDSANPYTCTMLATTDVFTSEGMHAYITAEPQYNSYLNDARLLHNFPAEVNAVYLEQQLPKINEPRRRFSLSLTAMLENLEDVRLFTRAYLYRAIRLDAVTTRENCWRLFTQTQTAASRRSNGVYELSPIESTPRLIDAMETFLFRRTDRTNSTRVIDFGQLSSELDAIEREASGGDWSRLINLLEDLIAQDLERMRNAPEQYLRDLGSVMQLLVEETIQGLHERIKNHGQRYDPNARPLFDVRSRAMAPTTTQPTVAPQQVPEPTKPVKTPPSSTAGLERLRELHEMYEAGDLTLSGLLKQAGKLVETEDIAGLREFYEMHKAGDLTEDGFAKRLARLFNSA